jgi:hypothetical protein
VRFLRTSVGTTLEAAAGAAQGCGVARAMETKRARIMVRMVGGCGDGSEVEVAKTSKFCGVARLLEGEGLRIGRHAAEGFFHRRCAFQYAAQYVFMNFYLGVHWSHPMMEVRLKNSI